MSMAERSAVHKFATGSSRLTTSDEFEHEGSEPFNVGPTRFVDLAALVVSLSLTGTARLHSR